MVNHLLETAYTRNAQKQKYKEKYVQGNTDKLK
jgi:hypothetical protein